MPLTQVDTPDGKIIEVEHPEGATDGSIIAYAQQMYAEDPSIAKDPTTYLGQAVAAAKSIPSGFAGSLLSSAEGAANLADVVLNKIGLDDAITEDDVKSIGASAESARKFVDESILGIDPRYRDMWTSKLGAGLGSLATFLTPGLALKAAGYGNKVVAASSALLGTTMGAGDQAQRIAMAEQQGISVDPADRDLAVLGGGATGLTEIFTPLNLLGKIGKGYLASEGGSQVVKRLLSAVKSGSIEATQEASAGLMQDAIEKNLYNESLPVGERLVDDFTVGGAVGVIADLALGSAARRFQNTLQPRTPTGDALTEEERRRAAAQAEDDARRQAVSDQLAVDAEGVVDVAPPQDLFGTSVDETAEPATIVENIAAKTPLEFPIGGVFDVEVNDGVATITYDGQQFGPQFSDGPKASEVANRLTSLSFKKKREADAQYLLGQSPASYNETQAADFVGLNDKLVDPTEPVFTATEVDLATDTSPFSEARIEITTGDMTTSELLENKVPRKNWTMSQRINAARVKSGLQETNNFSLKELRQANNGSIGKLAQVMSESMFVDPVGVRQTADGFSVTTPDGPVLLPTRSEAMALVKQINDFNLIGKRSPVGLEIDNEAVGEIQKILQAKNIVVEPNSKEMRSLIKRLIGKNVPTANPIVSLPVNERQYLYNRIQNLPKLTEPTVLPDIGIKVPRQETIRLARNKLQSTGETASRMEVAAANMADGIPDTQAEVDRVTQEAARTAQPIDRAGDTMPEGQAPAVYDPENTRLAQDLRDMLKGFGLAGDFATRLVDKIGRAYRDAEGNIYFGELAVPMDQNGAPQYVVAGTAQNYARVIQVSLDYIRGEVEGGKTYEAALAEVMNHEIVHALRGLDLFTAQEWALLEKLTRKYIKPGTSSTYANIATKEYSDLTPVMMQEEAIADMLADALTNGVVMDGKVSKPGGKVRQLLNRLVTFFKGIIGVSQKNDLKSFSELVDAIKSGQVGARERDAVRTQLLTEKAAGAIPARGLTRELLAGSVGRNFATQGDTTGITRTEAAGLQSIPDMPVVVDEELADPVLFSRRLTAAREQGFDTDTPYYMGAAVGRQKAGFRSQISSAIAGHFTADPKFAANFARGGEAPTIYPVYLRLNNTFDKNDRKSAEAVNQEMLNPESLGWQITGEDTYRRVMNDIAEGRITKDLIENNSGARLREDVLRLAEKGLNGSLTVQDAIDQEKAAFFEDGTSFTLTGAMNQILSYPANVDWEVLEPLAPFIKAAGFDSYLDIEDATARTVTGVAVFDNANVKGIFAKFNPDAVPEGSQYADDMLFSRKRVGRPETALRSDVAQYYQDLKAGAITPEEYQNLVADTVQPYDFIPEPATYAEMYNALTSNKKESINLPIAEGESVGLRLDIPAYTDHGVWVPTVHRKGGASYRATASISDADMKMTAGEQRKAQKVMEGGAKSPFARINGRFINRTDEQNAILAEQALNDPSWTQVGYDPRRRSVFYDRATGAPISSAEEVIQVGPLVLAKNATNDYAAEEILFSRKAVGTPITKAVERAKSKYADVKIATEEEFFGNFWPKLLQEVGGTVGQDKLGVAARRGVRDIKEWVANNPKYNDYYSADRAATRAALEDRYGSLTDSEMTFYMLINGLTSPGTSLPANVGDAVRLFDLYKAEGSFDSVVLGRSAKGNEVIVDSPISISGITAPTKARSLKAVDKLIKEKGGLGNAIAFLEEGVPINELNSLKGSLGYSGKISGIGQIRGLVMDATGQDTQIPRMFMFGPKIGAYTLNLMGNPNYTTVDVWESRFIRSYFDGMFDANTGITASAAEGELFNQFSQKFREEFNKEMGYDADPAALQAMRWFYMINSAKEAGYRGASTNETISELTNKQLARSGIARKADRRQGDGELDDGILYSRKAIDPARRQRIRDRAGRIQGRSLAPLEGAPTSEGATGPIPLLVAAAEDYAQSVGLPYTRQSVYVEVDPQRAAAIATAYDEMIHRPQDPDVLAAYDDLIEQTTAQYEALIDAGYTFSFFDSETDPYDGNPYNAMRDLRANNRMAVYGTYDGYGTDGITAGAVDDNPLLRDTGLTWPDQNGVDQPVVANDLFRAVHDAFGHGLEGAGFRARGEENAWQAHAKLFTGKALAALTSETRGQNSWLNFGPYGDTNRTASVQDTVFAEQKAGLMPEWTWRDGLIDAPPEVATSAIDRDTNITKSEEPLLSRRRLDPVKVEGVVADNLAAANMSQGLPRFSINASPEAQYIAQNPDEALTPPEEMLFSLKTADLSPQERATVESLTTSPPPTVTPLEAYMEATGEGKLSYWLTKFKQGAINRYARLEYLNQDPVLRNNMADSSSIAAALNADKSMGIVGAAIKYGVPVYRNGMTSVQDFSHNGRQYRGLLEVMSLLYSKEHGDLTTIAQSYAIAQRGTRLNAQGKPSPVTPQSRQEIENLVNKYTDATGVNPIKEWYSAWQSYNGYTIQFLKDTGILSEETANLWRDYADYVPFYRAAEGATGLPKVAQGAFGGLTAAAHFKEYKGSTEATSVPLIEAITLNLSSAIQMGMRNVAQQRIARDMQTLGLAQQLPLNGPSNGLDVKFKVNGKVVRFEINDPLVADSMSVIDSGAAMEMVTGILGKPAQFLRSMITRDPGFMLANMVRDTMSAYVTSGGSFIPVYDTVKGLGDGVESLERLGVIGGYDITTDKKDIKKFFTEEMRLRGLTGERGNPLNMFSAIWRATGDATTLSDAATRNAVYKDVLARTGNEAEAQFQASEIINFGRRGSHPLARFLTATIPFLNARMQGLDVFARAASGRYSANSSLSKTQIAASFAIRGAMLAGLTAAYWMLVSDDDQYKEQSEEVKDNYWLIPTSAGVPVRIPIPFEVGLLFKVLPETILATTYGDKSAREAYTTAKRGIVSTLEVNPLGIQAFAPLIEASFNKDSYTQREIVPFYMSEGVTAGLQDRLSSYEMAKYIGQQMNISPMKIEHVMRGYAGTIGTYMLDAVDTILKSEAVKGDQTATLPARNMFEYPVVKRFFASKEGSGLKQDAYELYSEVKKVVNTVNKLNKEGRGDELKAYIATRRHIYALKDQVYSVKGQLDFARKQRELIMRQDIDPELKREMIDDLDSQVNEYLKIMPLLKQAANIPALETTF